MDYKKLLKKYMEHVIEQEGTDFTHGVIAWEFGFTPEEERELKRMSDEIAKET